MATLIAVYNSRGCVGRCDAKCYNARTPVCECVCGGANHGAGARRAIENTQAFAQRMLDDYAKKHEFDAAFVNRTAQDLPSAGKALPCRQIDPAQTSLFP